MEIKLDKPIEVDGQTYSAVTVRDVTAADLAFIDRLNARATVKGAHLASRVTGLTRHVFQSILEPNPVAAARVEALITRSWDTARNG